MADSRVHALQQLRLKTVIKESHCSPVQHLDVNLCDADCRNLFATAARDQVTIYDDMHMGGHVAVVANLALSSTPEEAKDLFNACCWINSTGLSRHPYGDALLAVGGADSVIHIISIVQAAVVGQLPLPAGATVAELSAAASCPGLLLVLCRDGSLQLWQISSGVCLWSAKTDAFAAALHPEGSCVLTSSRTGKLTLWDLSGLDVSPAAAAAAAGSASAAAAAAAAAGAAGVSKDSWLAPERPESSAVDCIRFLTGDLLCLKSADGHMSTHSWPSGKLVSKWKVPGCGSSSSSTPSYSKRCSFGHTRDGRFVCVGNHSAAAYVFDTRTGRQVTRVEAIRVQGSVKACGLSEDCRHLLMVVGHGYVFRFEQRPQSVADRDSEEEEAAAEEGSGVTSDTEMADAAAADGAVDGRQQQQQQQLPGDGSLPLARSSPSAATTPAGVQAQQQQQQQECTPGDRQQQTPAGGGRLVVGGDDVDMAAPASAGSLDALMGCDTTPQGEGAADHDSGQQQQGVSGLSGGLQPKRQRRSNLPAASPLVFRPTPRK